MSNAIYLDAQGTERPRPEAVAMVHKCLTEANNMAINSVIRAGMKFVASAIEHKSVLEPGMRAASICSDIDFETCRVDDQGIIDLEDLRRRLEGANSVVSVMYANNEVGTIQPMDEIASICRAHGAVLHVDAAQAR